MSRLPLSCRAKDQEVQKGFFMSDLDEIKSPFLRKVLERRGINDDQVTSLLIVERYQRLPDLANSVVRLMLTAIERDLPLEAAIVRREVELGRALTDKEIEQEIREFQSKAPRQAA
jgi:hypothetical protein